jgi:hypothetical protein
LQKKAKIVTVFFKMNEGNAETVLFLVLKSIKMKVRQENWGFPTLFECG